MKIIVWLWNPGSEYAKTRHNVGFMFLDFLAEKLAFPEFKESRFNALISEKTISWEKIILLKPSTFMNLSWESVAKIINFYKLELKSDLFVIFDDISLDFGKIRYRDKWSAGWHNGIKSIIEKLASEQFQRIKIWVWLDEKYEVSDWVLSNFKNEELKELKDNTFPQTLTELTKKISS